MNKTKEQLKQFYNRFGMSFNIVRTSSTRYTFFRLTMEILSLISPFISAYIVKLVIDGLIFNDIDFVVKMILFSTIYQLLMILLGRINQNVITLHDELVNKTISEIIVKKVNELDISYFDESMFHDELENISRDKMRIPALFWNVISIVKYVIQIIITIFILMKINWYVPVYLLIAYIPSVIMDKKLTVKIYFFIRERVNISRKLNYIYGVLVNKAYAKDIRINNLYTYFKEKYDLLWKEWLEGKIEIIKKYLKLSLVAITIPQIITSVALIGIVCSISDGKSTVGDYSYYVGVISQMANNVTLLIGIVANIVEESVVISFFENFLCKKSRIVNIGYIDIVEINSIEFDNVSFIYPNTDKYVLNNISFKIGKGEKIGIIGKNGSGKSTIVKLLLRLYEPTEGTILVNGVNYLNYKIEDYYKCISTMLQDYINYCLKYKENIILNQEEDLNKLIDSSKKSTAYDFVKDWDYYLDSYLTKNFDDSGVEMSVGQWQKVALSKFFYRESSLQILDEPSASIDIESEKHIFNAIMQGKVTTIVISHKLKNVHKMDNILVVDNGILCESGTHDELISNNGIYYNLYMIEISKYQV